LTHTVDLRLAVSLSMCNEYRGQLGSKQGHHAIYYYVSHWSRNVTSFVTKDSKLVWFVKDYYFTLQNFTFCSTRFDYV